MKNDTSYIHKHLIIFKIAYHIIAGKFIDSVKSISLFIDK